MEYAVTFFTFKAHCSCGSIRQLLYHWVMRLCDVDVCSSQHPAELQKKEHWVPVPAGRSEIKKERENNQFAVLNTDY